MADFIIAGKRPFLIGLVAAIIGYALAQAAWALSYPQSPWTHLFFALFPTPVLIETARLIALYVLFGAVGVTRGGLAFALGFALFLSGAEAASFYISRDAGSALGWIDAIGLILAPLTVLALHLFLGLAGVAIKGRNAPPMAIFCVLTIIHGAHNGVLIAFVRELSGGVVAVLYVLAIAVYGALAFWLNALRREDRGGIG